MKRFITRAFVAAGFMVGVFSSAAVAQFGNDAITVGVSSGGKTGGFVVHLSDGTIDGSGVFRFTLQGGRDVFSDDVSHTFLAHFDGLNETLQDPAVVLGFAVAAGPFPTTFSIASALVTFPGIVGPTAHSSAGITLTDTVGDGAGILGLELGGNCYRADYNGLVPGGTNYSVHVPSFGFGVPFGTDTHSGTNGLGIAGLVSSMSSRFSFTLDPLDTASGTSTFVIIPSPAGAGALVLFGLAALRRRRH